MYIEYVRKEKKLYVCNFNNEEIKIAKNLLAENIVAVLMFALSTVIILLQLSAFYGKISKKTGFNTFSTKH